MKEKQQVQAKSEGTNTWKLSANSLGLKGKLLLMGNENGTPPWLPGH